ncbi:MAG: protein of unknown function DUF6 transrane [Magnetococcales bacterium]|nr:protein of unknown function DUF6 transrane [Magnetococcales bacterium]
MIAVILAAVLFGASTPIAKLLLAHTSPWLLAALLYFGSGAGLWVVRLVCRAPTVHLKVSDRFWLAGAIVTGGMTAPVLLMVGLSGMPATEASLLLNAEGVLTVLLAWFVFKENFDRRIALGMFAIIAGALVLSWPHDTQFSGSWSAFAVFGACLAWGIDNNLTRKVSLSDASFIAMTKGLVAGSTNLVLAMFTHATWPEPSQVAGALCLGFASYGASLTLFVIGLRHFGTARTGAYFSVAPFFGAILAVVILNEPVTSSLLAAGLLMAVGVWLHVTERHEHAHAHNPLEHAHEHKHGAGDDHHAHSHGEHEAYETKNIHSHSHRHLAMTHSHPHFPDAHHRHAH